SELIMKSADNMRLITQQMERSSQEQAEGGRQMTGAIENISDMVHQLHDSHRKHAESSEQTLAAANRIQDLTREYEQRVRAMNRAVERLRDLRLAP
ncbi:MAG: chemotaxis protein, partial [Myxococcales bacterium]